MIRQKLVCRLKGHLWRSVGPTPNPASGSYIVHRRCLRCGKYEKLSRQAVTFQAKG